MKVKGSGITTITTTPAQALSGMEIGIGCTAQCNNCHYTIGEAKEVALRAHRLQGEGQWTATAIYCSNCTVERGTIARPTANASEVVVAGRLVVCSDAATQTHRLVFKAEEDHQGLLDYSGLQEDDT